mgnify:CR=1 FL=1
MRHYFRPIAQTDAARPETALSLAGGWCWFDRVEAITRDAPSRLIPASDLPDWVRQRLTVPRPEICGLTFDTPALMGILNVTPDSFPTAGGISTRRSRWITR